MNYLVKEQNRKDFFTLEKCFITELLNSSHYPEVSIAKGRVEPGVTTEWHWLQQTDEMHYILSGKGQFEMDGEFNGTVEKGDLVFIPRNSNQRIKNITEQISYSYASATQGLNQKIITPINCTL